MTIYNAQEKPFSSWGLAEKFNFVLEEEAPDLYARCRSKFHEGGEYIFNPERKWRFDYCWPEIKLAVELDGFGWGHQSIGKLIGQYEKQNKAVQMGWKILRYNSSHLGSYDKCVDAVRQIMEVMVGIQ